MRKMDRDCKILCDIQAELFEASTKQLNMSSEVFVRRFMHSDIVREMDDTSFLDGNKTIQDVFDELEKEYGETNYGSVKYNPNAMYWAGYLYRCFAYTYEISSRVAYKLLRLKEIIDVYEPYHTLDITHAIERLLEAKNISFDVDEMTKRGVELLREIRSRSQASSK